MKNKKWKIVRDNKMRAFGDTDYDKKVISINSKKSKMAKEKDIHYSGMAKKETTVINTVVHEQLHRDHPRMTEKQVRKRAREVVDTMSRTRKQRLYSKIS